MDYMQRWVEVKYPKKHMNKLNVRRQTNDYNKSNIDRRKY
jgi:hypothetical protein